MLIFLWIWTLGAVASLIAYAVVSFWHDRRFVTSTWINLWLSVMIILGPIGTYLTVRTLSRIITDVSREMVRLQAAGEPLPATSARPTHGRRARYLRPLASLAGGHD